MNPISVNYFKDFLYLSQLIPKLSGITSIHDETHITSASKGETDKYDTEKSESDFDEDNVSGIQNNSTANSGSQRRPTRLTNSQ